MKKANITVAFDEEKLGALIKSFSYLYRVWFLTKINIYSDLSVHD